MICFECKNWCTQHALQPALRQTHLWDQVNPFFCTCDIPLSTKQSTRTQWKRQKWSEMERNGSKGIHLDGNWCSMCSVNLCITSFIHVYIFMLVFCVRSVSKPWASQPWDVAMCRAQACPEHFPSLRPMLTQVTHRFCLREVLICSDCLSPSQLLVRILARAYAAQCCANAAPDFEHGSFEDHWSMAHPHVLLRSYCHWQEQEKAQPGYNLEPRDCGSTLVVWATAIAQGVVFLIIMFLLSTFTCISRYFIVLFSLLWLTGAWGGDFSSNGRNLAGSLLQKPLKFWNQDRFECKSKRRHHKLWPLWQNTDGSMSRNFQKIINLEISTRWCLFGWKEHCYAKGKWKVMKSRSLMCEPAQFGLEGRTGAARMVPPAWLPRKADCCATEWRICSDGKAKNKDVELNSVTVGQTERRCESERNHWVLTCLLFPVVFPVLVLVFPVIPCGSLQSSIFCPGCISCTHATWLSKSLAVAARHDAVLALYQRAFALSFLCCPSCSELIQNGTLMLKAQFLTKPLVFHTARARHLKQMNGVTPSSGLSWMCFASFLSQDLKRSRETAVLCAFLSSLMKVGLKLSLYSSTLHGTFQTFQMQEQIAR